MFKFEKKWSIAFAWSKGSRSLRLSVIVATLLFGFLLTRPWAKSMEIQAKVGDVIVVKFERPNGINFVKKYTFGTGQESVSFSSLKPIEIKLLSETTTIKINETSYYLIKNSTLRFSSWESLRFGPKQLLSMLFFSAIFGCLFYFSCLKFPLRKDWMSIAAIVSLVVSYYSLTFPGIFWFDSYANLESAASYNLSSFTGVAYGLLMMSLYQLCPSLPAVHALNCFALTYISLCLFLDTNSKLQKVAFWIGLILLLCYPANANFNISNTRDVTAMWVTGLFILQIVKHSACAEVLEKRPSFWFLLVLSCALRQ